MKKYSIFVFFIVICSNMMASEPQIKSFSTQSDFKEGETKGISITSKGELQLSLELNEICNTNEPSVWDIVSDTKGKIFFSAGNEGKIYTIDKDGKHKLFCQLDEIEVYTLGIDNKNRLYAATSPDGKVYRLSGEGTATIFYDPPDKYIWDLLFDKQNNLYVATGDSGNIYKITSTGTANILYKSEEPQIRCLAWDKNGNLLAGSFGNGYVYRINLKGEAYVIYDSELKEIHQIVVDEHGTIYAAGLGQPPKMPLMPIKKTEQKKEEDKTEEEGKQDEIIIGEITIEAPRIQSSRETVAESAIFKIMPNGTIRNIWDIFNEPVQTIILENENKLLVGTGRTGKLVKILSDDEKTILLGLDESQISTFCKNEQGEVLVATANMGKIYKLQSHYRTTGYFLSKVIDSYTLSKWGSINWEGEQPEGCKTNFFLRTGNTEKPNRTWSNWSSALTNSEGENISIPDARFIQWKLHLATKNNKTTPNVKEVNISYLQKNLAPQIYSITTHPPGEYYPDARANIKVDNSIEEDTKITRGANPGQSDQGSQYLGRKSYHKGYRTVSWDVMDDNNDRLIYKLFYREKNDRLWKKLAWNWPITSFSWDSERLPDGSYFLKVVASDSLSNPNDLILTAVKISEPFDIDNTGPKIIETLPKKQFSKTTLSFTITDQFNHIKKVSYSIDGEDWKTAYPIDRIYDSKLEKFLITTTSRQSNVTHTVVIKAIDAINNIGFSRINF